MTGTLSKQSKHKNKPETSTILFLFNATAIIIAPFPLFKLKNTCLLLDVKFNPNNGHISHTKSRKQINTFHLWDAPLLEKEQYSTADENTL